MTFLLLSMQSIVCVACVIAAKKSSVISFRNFDIQDAKAWYPISCLLVSVIYTGSKSLVSTAEQEFQYVRHALTASPQQYLSIPVYTIFKNLTIILIVRLLFSVANVWGANEELGIRGSPVVRRTNYSTYDGCLHFYGEWPHGYPHGWADFMTGIFFYIGRVYGCQ